MNKAGGSTAAILVAKEGGNYGNRSISPDSLCRRRVEIFEIVIEDENCTNRHMHVI